MKRINRVPLPALFGDAPGATHARHLQRHYHFQLALRYCSRAPAVMREALRSVGAA